MKRDSIEPFITIKKPTKRRKISTEEKSIKQSISSQEKSIKQNISGQDQRINIYIQEICQGPIVIQN
jgi:hypothetical protein